MYELLFDALLVMIVGFTVMAVFSKDLLKSAIFLSTGALCTALVFFLLNAPDIAITKAAVEAGLATAIFIVAIQKTERFEKDFRKKPATDNGKKNGDKESSKSAAPTSPSSHADSKSHVKVS